MRTNYSEWVVNAALVLLVPAALAMVGLRIREATSQLEGIPEARRIQNWERLAESGHREGAPNAKSRVVWFSDFQCPYCKLANTALRNLQRANSGKIAVVYRHYPLSYHTHARLAATSAVCAERQGRFPEMRDALFAVSDSLGEYSMAEIAFRAGVSDTVALNHCLSDAAASAIVTRDSAVAFQLGLAGTPGIIVNGWALPGFPGDSALARIIRMR